MRDTYDKALALLIADEGGYVNDPHDSGGETNYGITWRTYNAYRKRKGLSEQSVKDITMQEVHEIYRAQYANVIRYDHLPAGLDYAVFDFAVNSGTKRASGFLQAIVGQRTDGVIGVQTLQAVEEYVATHGVEQLILRLCDNRLKFMQKQKNWKRFGKGWGRRVGEVKADALRMAAGHVPANKMCVADGRNQKCDGELSLIGSIKESPRSKGAAVGLVSTAFAALPEAMEAARPAQEFVDFARYAGWIGLVIVAAALVYIIWERSRATD